MEALRQTVRKAIGFNSPLYSAASRGLTLSTVLAREGLSTYRRVQEILKMTGGEPLPIRLSGLAHPFYVRPGTNDLAVTINNVVREEYGHPLGDTRLRTMVDAGAFIGDTSAYFLSRFPDLQLWSLEPNKRNFAVAEKNLAPYGDRVRLLPCGLASKSGAARFGGDAAFGSIGTEGAEIETISIPDLMSAHSVSEIDLLKIDIEGAEHDVLTREARSWLPKVRMIMIELHGPEIERDVLAVLRENSFSARQYRSIWVCRKVG